MYPYSIMLNHNLTSFQISFTIKSNKFKVTIVLKSLMNGGVGSKYHEAHLNSERILSDFSKRGRFAWVALSRARAQK